MAPYELLSSLHKSGDSEADKLMVLHWFAVDELPQDEDGTLLRPGVVWFNENLEEGVLDQVEEVLDGCDLLLIVGTSSVVYPAAGYAPQVAAR
jgi:NAD-dependent deacetylase sirtuin 5